MSSNGSEDQRGSLRNDNMVMTWHNDESLRNRHVRAESGMTGQIVGPARPDLGVDVRPGPIELERVGPGAGPPPGPPFVRSLLPGKFIGHDQERRDLCFHRVC